ncbi:MAG: glycoside hydrolase family 78 protein [Bacteroidetes bacterium]|nr:glycoside hydrolase family 78 protein [Bacteroidota bacterium]
MKIKYTILLFFIAFAAHAQVTVHNLRCELLHNPVGIGTAQPRFSWELQSDERNVVQQSYQILVSSSAQKLNDGDGDMWNSGVIQSSASLYINYIGKTLQSGAAYYWTVKVITNKGAATNNETASFSTGLLQSTDWKGQWIGYDKASPWDNITQWSRLSARYLRKEFETGKTVHRAMVYISGLGRYELYLNGNKIGDQVLAPNATDYRKSVFYNSFDVTDELKKGNNAIGVVLGNGRFFTMRQNYKTQKHNTFGYPKLLLQLELEYADGSKKIITSDSTWKLNVDGPIRTNNEYDGEEYDATKEFTGWNKTAFDDSKWMTPELVAAPAGFITAQPSEPVKVMQTIAPKTISTLSDGRYILDMGQNFSGWLQLLHVNGKRGDIITLRFAESLQPDGTLYTANLRDAKVTDKYTLNGKGNESWQPSFVYHGFRYVEVTGFPGTPALDNFSGKFIYDALETTGSFETSSNIINSIYKNAWWGIASNYKGMPLDCPQRNERQPWLGDRTVGEQGESFVFDNEKLYAKWMDDIEQAQTEQGVIPDVAPPYWNYYSDNVTWPAAYITVTNNLYNQYGDIRPIQKHYASMKKWIWYMKEKYLVRNIMTRDKYGDWCVPPEALKLIHAKDDKLITDGKLIATAYFYKLLGYMQRFAQLSGNDSDVAAYASLSKDIQQAFQKNYYKADEQCYDNNTITANLLPLYFGICPDSLRAIIATKIIDKIHNENKDHIATGLIGTQFIMRGLSDMGQTNIAYALTTTTTYPGWGYMVANGATTIWELWNGNTADPSMNSQNHVMLLGDLLIWYYENLAGIRSDKKETGFKKIILKPTLPDSLSFVNASYKSYYGKIISNWKKDKGIFEWQVTIPANTSATIYLPAAAADKVLESGNKVDNSSNIKILKWEKGYAVLQVASGHYQFKTILP